MGDVEDSLQPLNLEEIENLIKIYKNIHPRVNYIYNYLNSVIRWKKQEPNKNYIKLFKPTNGKWEDGTFVGVQQFWCYELVMFTLQENCETLCRALSTTTNIDWSKSMILYATHSDILANVLKCLENTPFRHSATFETKVCSLSKEKALKLEIICAEDVFIATLEPKHAFIINPHWAPHYPSSDKYLATMIGMNGGYGIFLKSNGKLVAWVIRNLLGLGALQTLEEYRKKGYGSLVTKALSEKIARDGFEPVGTVNSDNDNSLAMFTKIGFEVKESVFYVPSCNYESDLNTNEFPDLQFELPS